MDQYDKDNLNFILNLPEDEVPVWFESISFDDRLYAMELLSAYRAELSLMEAQVHDDVEELTEAMTILNKFTLKGTV